MRLPTFPPLEQRVGWLEGVAGDGGGKIVGLGTGVKGGGVWELELVHREGSALHKESVKEV